MSVAIQNLGLKWVSAMIFVSYLFPNSALIDAAIDVTAMIFQPPNAAA